ncbi:MAG: MerR family transcriptional regulator [Brevibacterium sp.]
MKIGDLSAATGVSVRSLRYYEEQELLFAERTTGGQRVYDEDASDRVRLIQCLYSAGLTSSSIALLLTCESTRQVDANMVDHARQQQANLKSRLDQLAEAHDKLSSLIQTLESAHAAQSTSKSKGSATA